jgi:putative acetyltransferase
VQIEAVDPLSPEAQSLIAQSDAYMAALYPAESNHLESVEALRQAHVLFVGAHVAGALVGCGAVKTMNDDGTYGEIKRVFVLDAYRGKGLSKAIMQTLEAHLSASGVNLARLETGIHQPEALGLYAKLGYVAREPFGSYAPDPLSLFMEKPLA